MSRGAERGVGNHRRGAKKYLSVPPGPESAPSIPVSHQIAGDVAPYWHSRWRGSAGIRGVSQSLAGSRMSEWNEWPPSDLLWPAAFLKGEVMTDSSAGGGNDRSSGGRRSAWGAPHLIHTPHGIVTPWSLDYNMLLPREKDDAESPASAAKTRKKGKRSTERGEGRAKLIGALTKYHKYADDGCLNLEPVGNNELARLAKVAKRTASAFFDKEFGGHLKYRSLCQDPALLAAALKALNGEFRPRDFYDARSPHDLDQMGE